MKVLVCAYGFGVFDDDSKFNRSKGFFRRPIIREIEGQYNAIRYAIDCYNEFQTELNSDDDGSFYGMPSDVQLNWAYFRKFIVERNREEYV